MVDCNGKCTYCGKIDLPNVSDGKEIDIGYSYAYKVDCDGNRYISAEEVKYLLTKARADTIEECIKKITNEHTHSCYNDDVYECVKLLEQLKEQKGE